MALKSASAEFAFNAEIPILEDEFLNDDFHPVIFEIAAINNVYKSSPLRE